MRQVGLSTLKRGIQDRNTAAYATRRLDDGQVASRDSQSPTFDDVLALEVTTAQSGAWTMHESAVPRDGDLDDFGCELGQVEPPRRCQPARNCLKPVAPHGYPNSGGVVEAMMFGEEHSRSASSPTPRSDEAIDGIVRESRPVRMGERDDTVVLPQVVVER
jgi:hypothetical protein